MLGWQNTSTLEKKNPKTRFFKTQVLSRVFSRPEFFQNIILPIFVFLENNVVEEDVTDAIQT